MSLLWGYLIWPHDRHKHAWRLLNQFYKEKRKELSRTRSNNLPYLWTAVKIKANDNLLINHNLLLKDKWPRRGVQNVFHGYLLLFWDTFIMKLKVSCCLLFQFSTRCSDCLRCRLDGVTPMFPSGQFPLNVLVCFLSRWGEHITHRHTRTRSATRTRHCFHSKHK